MNKYFCSLLFLAIPALFAAMLSFTPRTIGADEGEKWIYYATDGSGGKHYFNAASLRSSLKNPDSAKSLMVLVWDKRVPSADSPNNERELLILNEIDCASRLYRFLEGDAGYARITQPTTWQGVEHGTWRESLFDTSCKRAKEERR